jgi:hypothetical protein
MSRAYNLVIPLFVLLAAAWLASGTFPQFGWIPFCVAILHMSELAILRIYIVFMLLFLVGSIALLQLHLGVMLVPSWRRRIRPWALCHIAVVASLLPMTVCASTVSEPNFQTVSTQACPLFFWGWTKSLERDDPRYQRIVTEAATEADEYYKRHPEFFDGHPGVPRSGQFGYCHSVWGRMRETIRQKYRLRWKSPPEEHPGMIYD